MLKTGIVGAGVFGGYHAGKCAAHSQCDFIGVYDPHPERCALLVQRFGGKAFGTYEQLLEEADGVILASPATMHGQQAIIALKAGCHLYVEKPLATDLEQAETITHMAESLGLCVHVGHQERYVIRAIGLDRINDKPVAIKAKRFGKPSERGTDTSVTFDLMTHDLDLVIWLMDGMPDTVKGVTQTVYSEHADVSLAMLQYGDTHIRLEASRVEDAGLRLMQLSYSGGDVIIDFNAKTLINRTGFDLNTDFGQHPDARDSLGASVNDFIVAALTGQQNLITAGHGLRAMQLALQIDQAGQ